MILTSCIIDLLLFLSVSWYLRDSNVSVLHRSLLVITWTAADSFLNFIMFTSGTGNPNISYQSKPLKIKQKKPGGKRSVITERLWRLWNIQGYALRCSEMFYIVSFWNPLERSIRGSIMFWPGGFNKQQSDCQTQTSGDRWADDVLPGSDQHLLLHYIKRRKFKQLCLVLHLDS